MSAPLPIGRMRHRVLIEAPVDVADDNGGVARTYTPSGWLWASITPLRLTHRFVGDRAEQAVTHHIVFRHRDGMNAAMRLRKNERVFRILAIEDADAPPQYLRALCEEIRP